MVDSFLDYLKAEEITTVFGVPGGLLHPFFDSVECAPEMRLIVTRHECGAAFMADGYARVTGQVAVAAATSGPGATNLVTGVACAFADGVPMLVITGQAQSQALGKGAAQETAREDIDIVGMFRPITKYSAMVLSPDGIGHHYRRAMRLALSGRPGPVHLNVPVDFWMQPTGSKTQRADSYRPRSKLFDREQVKRAAAALLGARRPVLLVGSGASAEPARARVVELAERLGARVATTPRAKGLFPEDHPLSMGVLGFAGHTAAREALIENLLDVDLLFSIGASLNETTTLNWHPGLVAGRRLLQLDIDSDRIGRNYLVDVALVGDASTVLLELLFQIQREGGAQAQPAAGWQGVPPPPRGEARYIDRHHRNSEAIPLAPERWRKELCEVLPDDAIVYSDIGGHMLFNLQHLEIGKRQRFILNLGFGSMGHGTAAPIGTALALPGRPVVAIIGDACFGMLGMEIMTAAEYCVPVIWIVENNEMHGITWHGSKLVNGGRPMQSIVYDRPAQVAEIARAMGLLVWEVSEPNTLAAAFEAALESGRPCLIDVRTDPSHSPPLGDRAKAVAGFKRN
jgi:acetolactate synthase-1/2/3 large subunit